MGEQRGGDMTFEPNDIAHLQRELDWYRDKIGRIKAGTYNFEGSQLGNVADTVAEISARFESIVESIEFFLASAGGEAGPIDEGKDGRE
jgi:hypothetical protein